MDEFQMMFTDSTGEYTIVERSGDYMAFYRGNRKLWGCGPTPSKAVAEVKRTHADILPATNKASEGLVWQSQYEAIDQETDVSVLVHQTLLGVWHWSAFDLDNEHGIALSNIPGFDTCRQAIQAAEAYYFTDWLPHFKATGEREGKPQAEGSK